MILKEYVNYFYGVCLLLLLFTGCPTGNGDPGDDEPDIYQEIVTVIPLGTTAVINGSGGDGVFVTGRTLTLSPYGISRYEVTWELWDEVYSWAATHGYHIVNRGIEGHGTSGTGDSSKGWSAHQRKTRPATGMTWRDAIVWCNAYSEKQGLDPVYYESSGGPVLKKSLNDIPPTGGLPDTAADLPFIKPGANGFRLPAEAEWEFAARGGSAINGNQNTADWNYSYPGSNTIEDVAWYLTNSYELGGSNAAYGAHPVGSKAANRLGLYDMGGNVSEYCWDWYGEPITAGTPLDGPGMGTFAHRVMRGGGWSSYAEDCTAANSRNYTRPWVGSVYVGFRVAMSR